MLRKGLVTKFCNWSMILISLRVNMAWFMGYNNLKHKKSEKFKYYTIFLNTWQRPCQRNAAARFPLKTSCS